MLNLSTSFRSCPIDLVYHPFDRFMGICWGLGKLRLEGGLSESLWVLFYHGLIAVGISAIQLIPTAEYLISSQRSTAVDFELGLTYSFWPWRLLTLLAPNIFGNPGTANYWGYASYWEDAVYFGVLPLVLGLATLFKIGRKGNADPRQPLIRLAWGDGDDWLFICIRQ